MLDGYVCRISPGESSVKFGVKMGGGGADCARAPLSEIFKKSCGILAWNLSGFYRGEEDVTVGFHPRETDRDGYGSIQKEKEKLSGSAIICKFHADF